MDVIVICDEKKISKKNKKIWKDRTNGFFEKNNNKLGDIYSKMINLIPYYYVKNHNHKTTVKLINSLSIDILLNGGTPRKLSKSILNSVFYGVINVHPGLLPEYRGCSAVEWAIYNNDIIANTAHFMAEKYDNGPIIKVQKYKFKKNADHVLIRVKVYKYGCLLAGKALRIVLENKMKLSDAKKQNEKKAKYWKPIPINKFKKVIKKLSSQNYKFQNL